MQQKYFLGAALCVALMGCGKINDTMDATLAMKRSTEGMAGTTDKMSGTTAAMKASTDKLRHDSTLDLAIKAMFDKADEQTIVPPTTMLLGGAEAFAKEATVDKLMKFVFAEMIEVEKAAINRFAKKHCPEGYAVDSSCSDSQKVYSPAAVSLFNHRKYLKLMAMAAVAANTPQAVVESIVETQIRRQGARYRDTALQFLMFRAIFLKDFFLDERVFAHPTGINNLDKLNEAYEYLQNLQYIASLDFVEEIAVVTTGIVKDDGTQAEVGTPGYADGNYDAKIEPDKVRSLWKKLLRQIKEGFPEIASDTTSPTARRIAEIREVATRFSTKPQ